MRNIQDVKKNIILVYAIIINILPRPFTIRASVFFLANTFNVIARNNSNMHRQAQQYVQTEIKIHNNAGKTGQM